MSPHVIERQVRSSASDCPAASAAVRIQIGPNSSSSSSENFHCKSESELSLISIDNNSSNAVSLPVGNGAKSNGILTSQRRTVDHCAIVHYDSSAVCDIEPEPGNGPGKRPLRHVRIEIQSFEHNSPSVREVSFFDKLVHGNALKHNNKDVIDLVCKDDEDDDGDDDSIQSEDDVLEDDVLEDEDEDDAEDIEMIVTTTPSSSSVNEIGPSRAIGFKRQTPSPPKSLRERLFGSLHRSSSSSSSSPVPPMSFDSDIVKPKTSSVSSSSQIVIAGGPISGGGSNGGSNSVFKVPAHNRHYEETHL